MALSHLIVCVLVVPAFSAALLQRAATRQQALSGLRYSPQDPAARTLLTLDTNKDGRIDPAEVAAFARSQNLDAADATKEFSSIDVNGDGVLDSIELQQVLGPAPAIPPVQLANAEVAPAKGPSPTTAASQAKAVAAEELASDTAAKTMVKPSAVAEAAPQVAETAEVPVLAEATAKTELISEEARTSIENAAKKVSEELGLEEREEGAARELERKAAELRANYTALVKQTSQDALDAGVKAAHNKADELMKQISSLEEQAERAEVRASALKAKSKMEVEEGQQLMVAAQQALAQDQK